jgi:hypothetical protein
MRISCGIIAAAAAGAGVDVRRVSAADDDPLDEEDNAEGRQHQ